MVVHIYQMLKQNGISGLHVFPWKDAETIEYIIKDGSDHVSVKTTDEEGNPLSVKEFLQDALEAAQQLQ